MFNFSARPSGETHLSLCAVMIVKEDKTVTVVNPRTKAIVRFSERSFQSLLDLDGMSIAEAAAVRSEEFRGFLAAMERHGLIERAVLGSGAYNVSRMKIFLDKARNHRGRVILNPPALPTVNMNETCFFKCPHCYNDTNRHKASEMPEDMIIRNVILPLADMGCANVMWSGGDPVLTRSKTIHCTRVASSLGMSVATQAAEFSQEFISEFAAAGGKGMQVSLYSSPRHPEIDDRFRHRPGSWQMAVNNVVEARRKGLAVFINMVLFPDNVDELIDTADFAYELGVDIFRTTLPVITGRAVQNRPLLSMDNDRIRALLATALALRDRYSSRMDIVTDISECGNPSTVPYSFCSAGMTYVHIAEYKAFPCNFMMDDRFCLGSIRNATLDKIWRSADKLQDFRTTERIDSRCIPCTRREAPDQGCTDCKAVMWMRYGAFLNPQTMPCRGCDVSVNSLSPLLLQKLPGTS